MEIEKGDLVVTRGGYFGEVFDIGDELIIYFYNINKVLYLSEYDVYNCMSHGKDFDISAVYTKTWERI